MQLNLLTSCCSFFFRSDPADEDAETESLLRQSTRVEDGAEITSRTSLPAQDAGIEGLKRAKQHRIKSTSLVSLWEQDNRYPDVEHQEMPDCWQLDHLTAVLKELAPPVQTLRTQPPRRHKPTANVCHAVVILGVPTHGTTIAKSLHNRISTASTLLKKDRNALAIPTGAAVESQFVEAEVIAKALKAEGIDSRRIVVECFARTTAQNSENVVKILRDKLAGAPCTITVVTEPYHAIRALRSFNRACQRFEHSRHFVVKYARTKRLSLDKSSVYSWPHGPDTRLTPPQGELSSVCSAREYANLTRCIAEKYKMLIEI